MSDKKIATVPPNRYWMLFGISTAAMLALLVWYPEWHWAVLPFVCTYFVQAMDWL